MKKYVHPYLLKVYVKDLKGKSSFFFKGALFSNRDNYNSLIDLKSIFGKKFK